MKKCNGIGVVSVCVRVGACVCQHTFVPVHLWRHSLALIYWFLDNLDQTSWAFYLSLMAQSKSVMNRWKITEKQQIENTQVNKLWLQHELLKLFPGRQGSFQWQIKSHLKYNNNWLIQTKQLSHKTEWFTENFSRLRQQPKP